MRSHVIPLRDVLRGRPLPTTVCVPAAGPSSPLIVFAHGMWGNPGKFTWLLGQWAEAGFVVAAPAFPITSDPSAPQSLVEDVVDQPADVSFVLDELLARNLGDEERVGVGGFSLGAETALAVALQPRFADPRVRAIVAINGALFHPDFALDALLSRPLLLVHGAEDRKRNRLEEALRTYDAAREPKELVLIDGAGHGICQDDDPRPYAERVAKVTTAFWQSHLRA